MRRGFSLSDLRELVACDSHALGVIAWTACVMAGGCSKCGKTPLDGAASSLSDAGDEADADRRLPLAALNVFPQVRGLPPGEAVAAASWFAARGVTKERVVASLSATGDGREVANATLEGSHCSTLHVGSPPEEAILCQIGYAITERVRWFERARIFVVRNKAAVKVLDLVLAYVQWDDNEHYVDVALTLAADGQSALVGDRAPTGSRVPHDVYGDTMTLLQRCDDVLATARKEDVRDMTRICDARGTWSWQAARFVHGR